MSIKVLITDPKTGKQASVDNGEEVNALVVATRPLKSFYNKIKFFTNPNYGHDMNINVGFSGVPVPIHNGIDNVYWSATVIDGTWTFNSVAQAHTGTKSIDATATVNNDVAQIAKGSTIDLSDYIVITGWVYLSFWEDSGVKKIEIYGWNTSSSNIVGNAINLKDYINTGLVNSWQKFSISLADLGLINETIDAIRIRTIDTGLGDPPDYYLDDIQIEEVGNPIEFSIEPDPGTRLHVCSFDMFFVDAYSSTLTDATMPHLSYDKILGISSLTNGLLYQGVIGGKIRLTFPFRNLSDFLSFPGLNLESVGSDGTNTFLKLSMDLVEPIILQSEMEDKLSFTVLDDLSGLLKFNMSAACKVEVWG